MLALRSNGLSSLAATIELKEEERYESFNIQGDNNQFCLFCSAQQ